MIREAVLAGMALIAVTTVSSAQRTHPPPTMPRFLEGYREGESCGFDYTIVACIQFGLRDYFGRLK